MATAAQLNAQKKKAGNTTTVVTNPTRNAEQQNAAAQNANASTKGARNGMNPNADIVERNVQENYQEYGSGGYGPNVLTEQEQKRNDEAMRLANPDLYVQKPGKSNFASPFVNTPYVPPGQDPGVIQQLRTARQAGLEAGVSPGGQVNVEGLNRDVNGNVIGPATPQQIKQNTLNLEGIMNATSGMDVAQRQGVMNLATRASALDPSKLSKTWDGESTESYQQRQAWVAQQQAVILQQMDDTIRRANESQVRMQNTNALGQQPGQEQPAPGAQQPGTGMELPPTQFDPTDPAASLLQGASARLTQERDSILNAIGQPDYLGASADKAEAKQQMKDRLDLADEIELDAQERAKEKQRAALAENSSAQAFQDAMSAESILDQMKTNEDMEVQARRRINKLSGGHDFSGVKYVQKNIQDGKDAMHFLQMKAGILHGQYSDKALGIINDYGLDLDKAEIDKKTSYSTAYTDYTTRLNDIKEDLNKDEADRRKERTETHKWYSENLTKLDFEHGDNLNALRLKSIDRMNTLDKIRASAENNQMSQAIKMLALSTKKGVVMSPEAMAAFEKQIAPDLKPGWMAMSAGGGPGQGTGFKHWTTEGLAAAQQWVTAQPGRSFNNLAPADQEWLVPFSSGSVPGGPQAPMGPTLPGQNIPFNPFAQMEAQKPSAEPTYIREYNYLVGAGQTPLNAQGQPMNLQEYIGQRSFNFTLQQGGTMQPQQTIIQQPTYDPADEIITSDDSDSFDFEE